MRWQHALQRPVYEASLVWASTARVHRGSPPSSAILWRRGVPAGHQGVYPILIGPRSSVDKTGEGISFENLAVVENHSVINPALSG